MGRTTIENSPHRRNSGRRADADLDDLDGRRHRQRQRSPAASDTIMILRFDPATTVAAAPSLPPPVVPIAGTDSEGKINGASPKGDVSSSTIEDDFGASDPPLRRGELRGLQEAGRCDGRCSLSSTCRRASTAPGSRCRAGRVTLDGTQALAFAGSRHFQTFTTASGESDPGPATSVASPASRSPGRRPSRRRWRAASSSPTALSVPHQCCCRQRQPSTNNSTSGLANRVAQLGSGGVARGRCRAQNDSRGYQLGAVVDDA